MIKLCFASIFMIMNLTCISQQVIPLYNGNIPNSVKTINKEHTDTVSNGRLIVHKITVPTLTIFEAPTDKANRTGIIICPGGGYSIAAIKHEGFDVAKRFNEMGITAFVLKYRIPTDSTMIDKAIGPLQDAQRAIQYVRENAERWNIDKNKIGLMGFSAGGHLASTAGTHYEKQVLPGKKKIRLRPDFMILVYPVINLSDSLMHEGSRNNLLGKNPTAKTVKLYSNDLQVNKKTPPTFLVHAIDDKSVKVESSTRFYEALQKQGVSSEIYLYEKGGHGFGMHNPTSNVKWMDLVENWLRKNGWL